MAQVNKKCTPEGKRDKAGLKAIKIYAEVWSPEKVGHILDFVPNTFCVQILTVSSALSDEGYM
jgi:hypothetical protein